MSRKGALIGLVALLVLAAQPAIARAEFGITPGSEELSVADAGGQPETRAGAHPDLLLVKFDLNTVEGDVDGNIKDITIEMPPGLTGDPNSVPTCSRTVFDGGLAGEGCPSETQVGEARLEVPSLGQLELLIFNLEPTANDAVSLGAATAAIRLPISVQVRPGDYVTSLKFANLFQTLPITGVEVELWGIPPDHQSEPKAPRLPFLTLPSRCGEPVGLTLRVDSWQAPDVEQAAQVDTGSDLSGCDSQRFEPSVAFALASPTPDTPSGARIEIAGPDDGPADGRASAQIRDAVIALPKGVTLSSAGIAGLEGCSDAAFGLGAPGDASCPAASRVGSVELVSSALRAPIEGGLYMAQELPNERFRLFMAASGPGIAVKLLGRLKIDPATGQLTVGLSGMPQLPFERMTLSFLEGPRAPLITPLECGPLTTTAHFDSHGGAARDASDATELSGGGSRCPRPIAFEPGFVAGAAQARAGKETAVSITVRRRDGEQVLDRLSALLPLGISPALGTVEPCGPSAVASGECPPASRIGSALAEVGSGSEPATLRGSMFLTGPYRGSPFGLLFNFRALLGSFDMGTLAVRGALRIDPRTGQATLETASLPRMVEGVPIRFRTVGLDVDRPGFISNPTSCSPQSFEGAIVSADGTKADVTSPFEVRGCESLRFHPSMSLALRGAKQMHRRGKPGLQLGLHSRRGSINLRSVKVPFPRQLTLNPGGQDEICARPAAAAGRCPTGSQVGTAVATTALVRGPMKGSIYAVQPKGDGLPDLWTDLNEKGIHLIVQAGVSIEKGRLTTRLTDMPDLAVSALRMRFNSGSEGLFTLRQGLCHSHSSRRLMSTVAFEGQNRAFRFEGVELTHPACAGKASVGTHDD